MTLPLDSGLCRAILESLPAALYVVDRDRRILLWNDGAEQVSGFLRQDVVGRSCRDNILMHCNQHGAILCGTACPLMETMHDGHPREAEVYMRHKLGHRVPVRVRSVPVRNEAGGIVGAVEVFEERLSAPSAILDRASLEAVLEAQFSDFAARHIPFGLVCLHAEGLDRCREMYGRRAVDEVLSEVAVTLSQCLRQTDHLGWWAGNRLLAIIPGCWPAALAEIAESLKDVARQASVPWWGERLSTPVAVGSADVLDGDTPDSLLARCEKALHL